MTRRTLNMVRNVGLILIAGFFAGFCYGVAVLAAPEFWLPTIVSGFCSVGFAYLTVVERGGESEASK